MAGARKNGKKEQPHDITKLIKLHKGPVKTQINLASLIKVFATMWSTGRGLIQASSKTSKRLSYGFQVFTN